MFQGAFCLVKLHCRGERREDGRSIIGLLKEDALICAVSADIAEGVYGLFDSGEGDAGGIGVGMKDRVGSLALFNLPFLGTHSNITRRWVKIKGSVAMPTISTLLG